MGFIFAFVAIYVVLVFPVYVIGRRRNIKNPWVAFVPVLGPWIVLFETIGQSGWYSLIAFVPYLGGLVMLIWTAVELPVRHDRSRWWTLPLIFPGVNIVAYWFYALTLPRNAASFA
jgi:hypothetical protein